MMHSSGSGRQTKSGGKRKKGKKAPPRMARKMSTKPKKRGTGKY